MPKVGRKAPSKTHTQSVLFDRKTWTKEAAKNWLKEHGYQVGGLDETEGKLRFRQYDPESSKFRYRNQSAGKGITLVLGFPNKKRTVVIKGEGDDLTILGPLYTPWWVDTDKDAMTPEEVQKSVDKFNASGNLENVDILHDGKPTGAKVIQLFVAGEDNPYWIPGEAIAEVKPTPEMIAMAQKGELNGFSFKGEVTRTPHVVLLRHPKVARGNVEKNQGGPLEPHDHDLELFFDDDAKPITTFTGWNYGHRHLVKGTTATEISFDHGHPYKEQALKMETEPRVDVVTLLSDVDFKWISCVKNAANARPFAFKDESAKGEDMAFQHIQAIILPKDADIEALKSEYGEDWFKGLNLENPIEEKTTVKYVFAEKSEFKENTLDAVVIPVIENGLFFGGNLTDEAAEKAESAAIPINPMRIQVPVDSPSQPMTMNFSDVLDRKIYALRDLIQNTVEVHKETAKRKKNCKEHTDAFTKWLMDVFDAIGDVVVKMEKSDPTKDISIKLDKVLRAVKAKNNASKGESEMSDELLKKISDAIGGLAEKTEKVIAAVDKLNESVSQKPAESDPPKEGGDKPAETPTEKTEKPNESDVNAQLLEQIKQLTEKNENLEKKVIEVAEKQQSLEHSTTQTATSPEDAQTPGTAKKSEKSSTVLDGIPGLKMPA